MMTNDRFNQLKGKVFGVGMELTYIESKEILFAFEKILDQPTSEDGYPPAPQGYEYTEDFRAPCAGEHWVSLFALMYSGAILPMGPRAKNMPWPDDHRRMILRKI